jgi:hypothetical protein
MDNTRDEKAEGEVPKKTFSIIVAVIVITAIIVVFYYARKEPTTAVKQQPPKPSSPYTLTPSEITSAAGVAQNFTATYPIQGGWQNLSDASFYIAGGGHDQWVHYYPANDSFSFDRMKGSCKPGQATTLSTNFLTLNCADSSASGPQDKPTVTFSLTPRPSFSGEKYVLVVVTFDLNKASFGAVAGNWTVK